MLTAKQMAVKAAAKRKENSERFLGYLLIRIYAAAEKGENNYKCAIWPNINMVVISDDLKKRGFKVSIWNDEVTINWS